MKLMRGFFCIVVLFLAAMPTLSQRDKSHPYLNAEVNYVLSADDGVKADRVGRPRAADVTFAGYDHQHVDLIVKLRPDDREDGLLHLGKQNIRHDSGREPGSYYWPKSVDTNVLGEKRDGYTDGHTERSVGWQQADARSSPHEFQDYPLPTDRDKEAGRVQVSNRGQMRGLQCLWVVL